VRRPQLENADIWYNPSMRRFPLIGSLAAVLAVAGAFAVPVASDRFGEPQPASAILTTGAGAAAGPTSAASPAAAAATTSPSATPLPPLAAPPAALAAHGDAEERAGGPWPPLPSSLTGYRWPLPHGRLTNPFGVSWAGTYLVGGLPFHDGLDLATFCGDHIVAAHDGTVIAAGRKVDPWMGWVGSLAPSVERRDTHNLWGTLPIIVVIDDGNGYRSIYAHFNKIVVHAGQTIAAGQFLGYEGRTGFATGCHLHYGLFSPYETATMELMPSVSKRTKLPAYEIARINPLLVLPPRAGIPAPAGSQPASASPNPSADPAPNPGSKTGG
jgi:murein DD-endopeptidase MepM/ murein hydrolase activator NlpD